MDYMGSTLVVFAILLVVTIAALSFEPANPLQKWLSLAQRYATDRRPSGVQFPGERILFGSRRGRLKPLNEFVTFDVTIDDFGLWLVCNGVDGADVPAALKIPGTHVRGRGEHGRNHLFELYAEPPVRIALQGAAGESLQRRCQPAGEPVA